MILPCHLGGHPSLTIAALAERALLPIPPAGKHRWSATGQPVGGY
ncbi:MAG: hypothetical protein RMK34_00710 [Tepidimonas sp.]|nr:hypothetical protein [Tepidimonas sp.]MCS6810942.1 GMC family oxidoreductase [Tepidimonas sp.]MDW8335477.1 hypothetical protein [Tepidimonas sp.]